ncbi:hypothetical protein [Mycolicibacterium sp.]|uniref:hypothetical protein n=1 Tax=Mycolicibacterium sp. TaxID=2320850 RepID=UPI0037C6D16B
MFTDDMTLTEAQTWERGLHESLKDPTLTQSERHEVSCELELVQAKIADLQDIQDTDRIDNATSQHVALR